MPYLVTSEQERLRNKLETNSVFHDNILKLVTDRFQMSQKVFSSRYDDWRKSEEQHLAYVNRDDRDDDGNEWNPFTRSIVVPYTYAVLQTRLTFFFLALASKSPIIPMKGSGPNDIIPAKMLEIVNSYQINKNKGLSTIFCWLQDCERYGLGVVKNVWSEIRRERWVLEKQPVQLFGERVGEKRIKTRKPVTEYAGNSLINVHPTHFFADPRVNISHFQNGEFVIQQMDLSHSHILEKIRDGVYFNLEKVEKFRSGTTINNSHEGNSHDSDSSLRKIMDMSEPSNVGVDAKEGGFHEVKECWVRIIPKDYGLSSYRYPELWVFTILDNRLVIGADQCLYMEYPYYVLESNYDYGSPLNKGTPEILRGLQQILSWMFNSHVDNVIKVLNDVFIVDPSKIEMDDLFNPSPVKYIRLKQSMYGTNSLDTAIKQLNIVDVTRSHIQDSQSIINLIQRVSAATDNVMGMVEEVKRTATETSSTIQLATSRLKMLGKMHAINGFTPLIEAMTFNNQSFLEEGRYFNITDSTAEELGYNPQEIQNRIFIPPDQLFGEFDYLVPDLNLPVDQFRMAEVWRQIIQDVVSNEIMLQEFDIVPMVKQALWHLGVGNINDYRRRIQQPPQTQVVSDERFSNGVSNGEFVPVNNNGAQTAEQVKEFLERQQLDKKEIRSIQ